MRILDSASDVIEIGCKGTSVILEGGYHGAAMFTGVIKEERKVQNLKCKMKTHQTIEDFVAMGFDRSIAEAECARIDAEIR